MTDHSPLLGLCDSGREPLYRIIYENWYGPIQTWRSALAWLRAGEEHPDLYAPYGRVVRVERIGFA